MITNRVLHSLVKNTSFIILTTAVAFALTFNGCGRKNSRKIEAPPSLMPPQPPEAPSMIGADTIWNFAGNIPTLPGNEEALFDYIGRNLIYPVSAKDSGIQGRVVVKFIVNKKGDVINHEVIKSVHPDLDAEALRVVKTITHFEPGYSDSKAVTVWYEVPISFVLK
ncbi:MAG TPA: energy transducer TonB [Bacteroidales bacterium]|nr:energy transducer TonB [Bacteroidales bacterium]